MGRLRTFLIALAVASTVAVVGVAQPAQAADPALPECLDGAHNDGRWHKYVGGNNYTIASSPYGFLDQDAFRLTAEGSIKIDWWGTTKSVGGELPVAPSGWPLPGERRYMLIAKINQGSVWVQNRSRSYAANEWFPVGNDSGCVMYTGPNSGAYFTLSFNDSVLNDNGGAIHVYIDQWWIE